ncbi:zinc finger BED domain-containing protein RICESLEEPER 2-like [Morus notabilis]|uniref:zinc finger BED domain-containing protein RICESLEEPER 2-like n=1 Tax=Morus notabilis TaxID=981085 RepID=UPI000CED07B2|nr:zinc finger BED domain-containing protein RICESLEEPER 2-like [Morus notabilis]
MEIDLESIESQSVDVDVEEIDGLSFHTKTQDSKYGTGNLKRRLVNCLKISYRDIGQMLIAQEAGAVTLSGGKYDPEKFRELVVATIIMHDLPFSFVEYAGIRSIFQYLHPQIQLVSRNTAKADALKFYKREKLQIKLMLETIPGRIIFTSDAWTSLTSDGYVFSVTLDNASANGVSVDMLREQLVAKRVLVHNGDLFHMRCCAHILNLVVQEGLKQIDDSIVKIRDSVKYVKGSQVRKQKFLDCVKLVAIGDKKWLCQDVPTKWNSTYLMLESALYYRRVFQHLELSDSNYKHCPSSAEWDKVEKIKTFLKLFYDATLKFSGTKYPTANLYFPSIWHCCFMLKQYLEGDDEYLKYMATAMWGKFQKYWSQFHLTLAIACVLDPRFKLRLVEFSYKKLYGDDCVECISMRSTLYSIFEEYNKKKKASTSQRPILLKLEFDEMSSVDSTTTSQKSELDLYLDEPRLARTADLDILSFWKSNQFRYPALASMACDILVVPVSTVASEATFSVGGRVLDSFRSSLKPKTVEALVCTRDWLYGEKYFNEEVEDLTQDIFNFSLKEDEPFSQGSTSPERNDALGVAPM